MIELKTIDKITVEDVLTDIDEKRENVTFGEMLIDTYDFSDEGNTCTLHSVVLIVPVYTKDNQHIDSVIFNLDLGNAKCGNDDPSIDEKLYEIFTDKIDKEIMQA